VDEVLGNAVAADGGGVKEAAVAPWGDFGYFSELGGFLWKVAFASYIESVRDQETVVGSWPSSQAPGVPLSNARPLRKGESHPRAKEKKFCQSFCVILFLCTARSGDEKAP